MRRFITAPNHDAADEDGDSSIDDSELTQNVPRTTVICTTGIAETIT